jgi:transposase InsO family protein
VRRRRETAFFVNPKFPSYYEEHSIFHELTAPYTPDQNGQVERLNGSLIALVKAMLHDSKLDKSFWSYALSVATHVGNRTAHARLGGKTSYEILMNKRTGRFAPSALRIRRLRSCRQGPPP